jgi:hypothetical protein
MSDEDIFNRVMSKMRGWFDDFHAQQRQARAKKVYDQQARREELRNGEMWFRPSPEIYQQIKWEPFQARIRTEYYEGRDKPSYRSAESGRWVSKAYREQELYAFRVEMAFITFAAKFPSEDAEEIGERIHRLDELRKRAKDGENIDVELDELFGYR